MSEMISINKLPTRTWNRLSVNDAIIAWDEENTALLADTDIQCAHGMSTSPVRLSLSDDGASFTRKRVRLSVPQNSSVTVLVDCRPENNFNAILDLTVGKNSDVKLALLAEPSHGGICVHKTSVNCDENAGVEMITLLLGDGDVYLDNLVELRGDNSSLKSDIAYIGCNGQTVDMNVVVNHFGRNTKSEINAAGALKDGAKKVFRGSIDFRKGSSGSVGAENETVLMLGDDAVNKTVPLILCAEENVDGNHGATIGELDRDTLFYFESRGIDKKTAENIMARAAVERLAHLVNDEEFADEIMRAIGRKLGTEGENDDAV